MAKKKNGIRRWSAKNIGKILTLVVLVATIGAFFPLSKMNDRIKVQETELAALRAELDSQTKREKRLQEQKEYQKTDEYLEMMARDRLGLAKPNEILLKPE